MSLLLLLQQISHESVARNNTNVLSYGSGGQKPKMGFTGLKSRCKQGCSPLDGENTSFLFQLLQAACLPFSLFRALRLASSDLYLTVLLPVPSYTYRDPFDYVEPTWIFQDNLPISRAFT